MIPSGMWECASWLLAHERFVPPVELAQELARVNKQSAAAGEGTEKR